MVPCQVAAVSPARGRLLLMPQPALTSGREASTGFLFLLYTLTAKELDPCGESGVDTRTL